MIVLILGEVGIWELVILLSLVFCFLHRQEFLSLFVVHTSTPGDLSPVLCSGVVRKKDIPSLGTYHNCSKVIKKGISSRH